MRYCPADKKLVAKIMGRRKGSALDEPAGVITLKYGVCAVSGNRLSSVIPKLHETLASTMSETYELKTVEENAVCPDLDLQIRAHLERCFPDSPEKFQIRRVWHNVSPEYTVIACKKSDDGSTQIVGHVAVVIRTITTTWNWRYNVASIQGVSVAEQCRHTGLAVRMLQQALEEARQRGYLYAVLFCKEPLVPFYEKQGWRLTDDSVIMRNEQDCPIKMRSNCPMYKELTAKPFPEGPVDVHNPEQVGMARRRDELELPRAD